MGMAGFARWAAIAVFVTCGTGCRKDGPAWWRPESAEPASVQVAAGSPGSRPSAPAPSSARPADAGEVGGRRKPSTPARAAARGPTVNPGAIDADILVVNNQVVTISEILYAMRPGPVAPPPEPPANLDEARRRVLPKVQQAIGTLLLYQKATAKLDERTREALDKALTEQIKRRASMEFDGSVARFEEHLAANGLTMRQFRESLERQLVARDYIRETIAPQITVTRQELLDAYSRKKSAPTQPETRELLMIEAPFAAFLPEGETWRSASPATRAAAEAAAEKEIRTIESALRSQQTFSAVVEKYDRGPQKPNGGSWGWIGKPLKAPYDEPSRQLFTFRSGQCSTPIRIANGWVIVKCGGIRGGAVTGSFEELQSTLREELLDQRFAEFTQRFLVGLAEKATLSSIEEFLELAARRYFRESQTPRTAQR